MSSRAAHRNATLLSSTSTTALTGGTSSWPMPEKDQSPRDTLAASESGSGGRHLNQTELSRRWNISPRTLERWRWMKTGPPFLKIGGRVVYAVSDIVAYETSNRHTSDGSR